MYELLKDIAQRPEPFSRYTAMDLWTRPHLARQMLNFHLNQETDLASRRFEVIDQAVDWIDSQLHLSGKRICDLGCGPGLYAQRFSNKGADVTGVDFSARSLEYADLKAKEHDQSIRYIHADLIIEPNEIWQIFSWMQHYTSESLQAELRHAGFAVVKMVGGLTGKPSKTGGDFIGVIAIIL